MALKPCVECGTRVSTTARQCPNCGSTAPHTSTKAALVYLIIILGLGIGFILLWPSLL